MTASKKPYIVVGGGLAGLFSARVLKHFGAEEVYVIEKSSDVGGMLGSYKYKNPLGDGRDFDFDHGAHFVLSAMNEEVDRILEKDLDKAKYHEFRGSLREGQYINGALYQQSGCANVSMFAPDIQDKINAELMDLATREIDTEAKDAYELLLKRYGKTATEAIFVPAFEKLAGVHPRELSPSMETMFFAARLIIAGRKDSILMKEDPNWDWRVAFADCGDGESDIVKYYPREGGVGLWMDDLARNLSKDGVHIFTGCTVQSIAMDGDIVESVTLSDGRVIECAHLVWTLPAIFLAKMTGVEVDSVKPSLRFAAVHHFITDKRPVDMPYWITNFDPKSPLFRVLLYDNFAPNTKNSNAFRISVSVLHGGEEVGNVERRSVIFDEMKKMQVLPAEANLLWSDSIISNSGFPLLTDNLKEIYMGQIETLGRAIANVSIVGNRPDTGAGQIPVMNNVYATLKALMVASDVQRKDKKAAFS